MRQSVEGIVSLLETHTAPVALLELAMNLALGFLGAKTEGIMIYN